MKKRNHMEKIFRTIEENWKEIAIKQVVPALAGCVLWMGCIVLFIVQMGNLP